MFRKVALTAVAAVLVASALSAAPASAASISNGTACSKAGASTKSGGTTYKCAKNLLVNNSKLTWLSADCISLTNAYLSSKKNLPTIKATSDATVAKLKSDLVVQQAAADKATASIADYQAKIVVIQTAVAKLKADTANATKNAATIKQYEQAIASYNAAIKALGTVSRQLTRTKAALSQSTSAYDNAKVEVATGLSMATLICTKGY
jgi:parvulin-like peptidyl-prolyl isomerase